MIRLEGIGKRFAPDGPWAVRDLSLTVPRGAFVALIGASGCGKTTTLRAINRLIEPTIGRVWVDGRDTATVPGEQLRRGIGCVLQSVGLFPHWTVAENVGAVPRLLGWPEPRIRARVDELLELVGLPPAEFRERAPSGLSGGQRQRVGIARAIAAEPSVLLMDEPFGALDPVTRDRLQQEIRALHDGLGLTTVMVTHDMAEALLLADAIAVMDAGRLVRFDAPRALLADPGHPAVAALLDAPRRHALLLDRLTAPAGPP
jgi:osmoprotectant transport system ATP-binding protein